MKAEELRLGNYVYYNGMNLQVYSIQNKFPRFPEGGRWDNAILIDLVCDGIITCTLEEVSGIPLNEEIFLSCGFKYLNEGNKSEGMISPENEKGIKFKVEKIAGDFMFAINPYYYHKTSFLHELQNLYYILTKKELEVN